MNEISVEHADDVAEQWIAWWGRFGTSSNRSSLQMMLWLDSKGYLNRDAIRRDMQGESSPPGNVLGEPTHIAFYDGDPRQGGKEVLPRQPIRKDKGE